jgi:hypothetical protein
MLEVVRLLLTAGAHANAASPDGQAPLISAAGAGQADVLQLLLLNGADLQMRDVEGNTALWFAAAEGRTDVVQLLLEAWSELEVPAADLILGVKAAALGPHLSTAARLLRELQRLHPANMDQVFEGVDPISAADAAAALAAAWATDVSSLDEQRAAVHKREKDVASEKQAVQHLNVGMAGMAKHQAQGCPTCSRPSKRCKENP